MKRQPKNSGKPSGVRNMLNAKWLKAICIASIPLVAQAQPQNVGISYMANDVKDYSMTLQTDRGPIVSGDPTEMQAVMAGTIYDLSPVGFGPDNVVHFARMRGDAMMVSSVYYDDPNYIDERAVSIVGNGATGAPGTARYYIVSQIRPSSGGNDRIRIQTVDYNGTPIGNAYYITAAGIQSLYPMHAIYHTNGQIYVCGYTTNGTNLPNNPGFATNKEAFVIAWNPATNSVTGARTLNTAYAPAPPIWKDDFDMAMRLTSIPGGNIHVTGSVNAYTLNIAGGSGYSQHSATMNYVLDNALNVISNNHFIRSPQTGGYTDEYGIGLVNTAAGDIIMGNQFYRATPGGQPTGFDMGPSYPWVNWVSATPNYNPGGGISRFMILDFNYMWALQAFNSPVPGNIRMAGMQFNEPCGMIGANTSNILPFFLDISLSPGAGSLSTSTIGTYRIYQNQTGTGTSALPNSPFNLGNNLNIFGWTPALGARDALNSKMTLNAPKWNPSNNKLNLKTLVADDNTLVTGDCVAPTHTATCVLNTLVDPSTTVLTGAPYAPAHSTGSFVYSVTSTTLSAIPYTTTVSDCFNFSNYKEGTTGIINTKNKSSITQVHPNPAKDHVNVMLAPDLADDTKIKVTITNLYGQVMAVLYSGNAATLKGSTHLSLPELANGIYTVQVWADEQPIHLEKILVEQ